MSDSRTKSLGELARKAGGQGLPPVNQWHPDQCGEIDIRIARNGDWYHEGVRFEREALVRLFSTILRRDEDEYFLVTPAEKLRIDVEDAPFVITGLEVVEDDDGSWLQLQTNVGDRVRVDAAHPLRVESDPDTAEPSPYVRVRDRLDGLIGRPVYYQLIELGREAVIDGHRCLVVQSGGKDFVLGVIDE